jgi:probable rRNA maturation factor
MGEPPSPTAALVTVVAADEQAATDGVTVDVERWATLARAALDASGAHGELTLTFVDRAEIAALNAEHLGKDGPTDVLSFPLDADDETPQPGVPVLLGDVVVCPAVAADQASAHAGTVDDEVALLVVHGVLHVLGHDHADPAEGSRMRERELTLLQMHHWHGDVPTGFRQEHES